MRTTLTIEDDLAVELERLRRSRDTSFNEIVNEALRRGLREMSVPPKNRGPFRTQASNMGEFLVNVDNVAEALAYLEGEDFK